MSRLTDDEVIALIAPSLVHRCVGLVSQRDLVPQFGFPADIEGETAEAEAGVTELFTSDESELEDSPPDPVVPPEYIRIAIVEAAALDTTTMVLNAQISTLRFTGMASDQASKVAEEFPAMARMQGAQMLESVNSLAMKMVPLATQSDMLRKPSLVADALKETVNTTVRELASTTRRFGEALEQLVGPAELYARSSEVGQQFRDVAGMQARDIGQATRDFGHALDQLVGDTPDLETEDSLVVSALRDHAENQRDQMQRAARDFGTSLGQLVGDAPDLEMPSSEVGEQFRDVAVGQGGALQKSIQSFGLVLGPLADGTSVPDTEPS